MANSVSPAGNVIHEGRRECADHKMECLAISTRPQPLSPAWEAYNTGVLQPLFGRSLEGYARTGRHPSVEERMRHYERCNALHPFNKVNTTRANGFLAALGFHLQRSLPGQMGRTKPWWHTSAEETIEMIKKERQEIDALGYIVGFGGKEEDRGATSRQRLRWEGRNGFRGEFELEAQAC